MFVNWKGSVSSEAQSGQFTQTSLGSLGIIDAPLVSSILSLGRISADGLSCGSLFYSKLAFFLKAKI